MKIIISICLVTVMILAFSPLYIFRNESYTSDFSDTTDKKC